MTMRRGIAECIVMATLVPGSGAIEGQESKAAVKQRIAFESIGDGNDEIYVMNADGSGQTNLTGNEYADSAPV